jgi:hypothetical protein
MNRGAEQRTAQGTKKPNDMTFSSTFKEQNVTTNQLLTSPEYYRRLTIRISLWGWLVGVPKMYIFDIIAIHYNFPRLIIAQALIEFTMIYYTGNKNCLVSHSPFFLILLQQQHNNIIILTQFLTLNARCQQHDGI